MTDTNDTAPESNTTGPESADAPLHRRGIKSYVIRAGRMTQAQQPAGSPSRFCSNSGTGLSPQAGFCPQCGTAVSPIQAPGLIPTQQERQPRQPVEPPQPQVWQPSSTPAYSPPDRVLPNSFGLGGRGSRLGAAIIDGLIGLVPYIVLVAVVPILGLLLLAGVFILQMILLTKDGQTL